MNYTPIAVLPNSLLIEALVSLRMCKETGPDVCEHCSPQLFCSRHSLAVGLNRTRSEKDQRRIQSHHRCISSFETLSLG